jgi:pimeloyl-ACP methyl ester carboxylesterase
MRQLRYLKLFLFILSTMGVLIVQAQTDAAIPDKPLGKLVDIGGWRLHLYGQGTSMKQGPTVILINGVRGFSFDWCLVQPKVASFARVYSYDRAGSTWSDLGPRPHTIQQEAYELHTLLEKAKVPAPYVLVGASYGGFVARLFAQKYPREVAGMVLVDAGYEDGILYINGRKLRASQDATNKQVPPVKTTATREDNTLPPEAVKVIGDALSKMVPGIRKVEPPFDKLPDSIQKMRVWALSKLEYYAANDNIFLLEERAGMIRERAKQPQLLGNIPLIVLTATNTDQPDTHPEEQERRKNQAAMTGLSRNSKQILAKQSGHHIHVEEPDLVIDAIRQVTEAINKKESLKK